MRTIALGILTLCGVVATALTARAESPLVLTVRVYNAAGVASSELLAARRAAEPILADTGLAVTFRLCGTKAATGGVVDACDDALKPSEVVVRLIDAPVFSTTLHPDAYGVTYVVEATNSGWLATVFPDRVAQAASRADADAGTVLGRVMAHELGHLLLGSGYHGEAGVMRAEWPDELLHRKSAEEWHFSLFEAARMQRALALRHF